MDLRDNENVPRILLNADDDAFFAKLIVEGGSVAPNSRSETLIRDAYEYLKMNITFTANNAASQWSSRLIDWVDFLKDRTQVILVEVQTESDAFLIFEILIDRGADLTIADLLKNYLFSKPVTVLAPYKRTGSPH